MSLRLLRDVSPLMLDLRLRFRRACRMALAVLQHSLPVMEPRLPLGVWRTRFLPLRRCSGGAGDRQQRVAWWLAVRGPARTSLVCQRGIPILPYLIRLSRPWC
jgi:hypothetical protein